VLMPTVTGLEVAMVKENRARDKSIEQIEEE
jgi:hypothetical protein